MAGVNVDPDLNSKSVNPVDSGAGTPDPPAAESGEEELDRHSPIVTFIKERANPTSDLHDAAAPVVVIAGIVAFFGTIIWGISKLWKRRESKKQSKFR